MSFFSRQIALPLGMTVAIALANSLPLCGQDQDEATRRTAARVAMVARIDELVEGRVRAAGFEPAARSSDPEFVRRVYLDLTGAIPRVADVREFLQDESADKRARLIDELLDSPAHATHLANTWRNMMLPGGLEIEQINNLVGVQNWLRQRFVDNLRYDNLVSDLIVATEGDDLGPALYYTSLGLAPEKLAASTARIFLGVQIECAECHDHPFDQWKQRDFWGYAAFFARLKRPDMNNPGRMMSLEDLDRGEVTLPGTEDIVLPKFPAGRSPGDEELGTRREQLAIWMASRDNPYLPRAAVNRVWWNLFGRGLVEPVDDLGPQNPASHPEVFRELTDYFIASGFDLRELYRTLANTAAYQRTSVWTSEPAPAAEMYVHMPVKTLSAEQLYDSVNRVLHRKPQGMMGNANVSSPLLDPQRQAFIARMDAKGRNALDYQAGVLQALALLNGRDLAEATDPERSPLLGSLKAPFFTDDDRLRALFLATLSRQPTDEELTLCREQMGKYAQSDEGKAYSDVLWALLNSAEFALNH